jgi:3-hydroxybutyrate dehydrogenase
MKRSESGTGVIGNLTSVHAHVGMAHHCVYTMTHFGLRGLAQSISAEGNGRIRSFTVSSGPVRTGQTADGIADRRGARNAGPAPKVLEILGERSRVKEPMAPIEVANVFLFGFSRYARYLVGGDLLFDGGAVLTY